MTQPTMPSPKPEQARDAVAELRDAQMVAEHAATCVSSLFAGVAPKLLHPTPVPLEPLVDATAALIPEPALWPLLLYFIVGMFYTVGAFVIWLF